MYERVKTIRTYHVDAFVFRSSKSDFANIAFSGLKVFQKPVTQYRTFNPLYS